MRSFAAHAWLLVAAFLTACGSSSARHSSSTGGPTLGEPAATAPVGTGTPSTPGSPPAATSGSGTPVASGAPATTASPASSGVGTDAGAGDEGGSGVPQGHPPLPQAPANPVGGFAIDFSDPSIQTIQVPPGGELFPCLVFPLDLQGTSHIVAGGMLTTAVGLHHGNITTRPSDGTAGIHPCPNKDWNSIIIDEEALDILAGGQVLFGSTTQVKVNEWQSFPPGMGYAIKDGFQIIAHMHYMNPGSQTLTPMPKYQWFTIDPATLTQQLYPFAWELKGFSIAPRTQQTFTGQCDLPTPMHIVNVLPHMHGLGTGLDLGFVGGALDGKPFMTSPGYSPDQTLQMQYTPAVDLSQGTGMSMSCTWNNTTDQTIVEGTGVNEMCMIFGYAWPSSGAYSAMFTEGDSTNCIATISPSN